MVAVILRVEVRRADDQCAGRPAALAGVAEVPDADEVSERAVHPCAHPDPHAWRHPRVAEHLVSTRGKEEAVVPDGEAKHQSEVDHGVGSRGEWLARVNAQHHTARLRLIRVANGPGELAADEIGRGGMRATEETLHVGGGA